ncbi:hypothetical protein LV89_02029 [Arcicella aurantiaca]|uniref:Uncharacterized protein n=1 Tax=Arcicella aurantiaca TaxID=591202 RepID=A0A316EAQ7_9BACT|nr:hypothetical protein [Arcicella aurantiaca]PWK27212.1 hypothetical protein LV89_02029 [Arcicella aurantiaca]
MPTLQEIAFAFHSKHRTDRGRIGHAIAERIGLKRQQVLARLRGDVPIADSEMDAFLEELKLPKES